MRTVLLVVSAFLFVLSVTEGQSEQPSTAQGVVEQAEARYKDGVTNEDTKLYVKLIDSRGRENMRKLRLIVAYEVGEGDKKLLLFLEPANVCGVWLVNHEYPDRVADQWLFLKSAGKVRRVVSGSAERFVGTDYSIADTRSENTRQWTYRNLTEETLTFPREQDGLTLPCYRVEAVPREGTETAYSRRLLWVHHDLSIIVKEELYGDGLMKTRVRWGFAPFALDAGGKRTVLRARFEKMTNHRGEHHETILEVDERHVNKNLPDWTFKSDKLENKKRLENEKFEKEEDR